tara:strand:- start:1632 stop:2228 length:597 start_codon:yes stop_codon:yes gene_type:complete
MFNRLYQKTLKLAAHKSSNFFLAIVAFAESSFFPIPPDIMIVPMVMAKRTKYIKIFLIATISSALGGLLGYLIGLSFLDLAMNLVEFYGYEDKVLDLKNNLSGGAEFYIFLGALFLAGFTPLPFKVFTITSGIVGFNIFIFFFICLISRGIRFFVVSFLTYKFGNTFNDFIKNLELKWFGIFILIIITFGMATYFVIK